MTGVVTSPRGETAELLKDPVCGMNIPADSPLRTTHAGNIYVFCAESCQKRFARDPAAFIGSDVSQGSNADGRPPTVLQRFFRFLACGSTRSRP